MKQNVHVRSLAKRLKFFAFISFYDCDIILILETNLFRSKYNNMYARVLLLTYWQFTLSF